MGLRKEDHMTLSYAGIEVGLSILAVGGTVAAWAVHMIVKVAQLESEIKRLKEK